MTIKVLGKRVLIERDKAVEKTAGGIIIPETQQEKEARGLVISVGRDVKDVVANDRVLFNKWSGLEIKIEGKEYTLTNEEDILGII